MRRDRTLLWATVCLLATFGLIFIHSSSKHSSRPRHNPAPFFRKLILKDENLMKKLHKGAEIEGQHAVVSDPKPLRLGVYFEVQSQDCKTFINAQLAPAWEDLKDIMTIDLYPYGNAKDSHNNNTGGYDFECQHGFTECMGDIMLACAQKQIPDKTTYVEFTSCIIADKFYPENMHECATRINVSYTSLETCALGIEGQLLLHDMGVRTAMLHPPHSFVPWITVDGVHTHRIQHETTTDLRKFVCKHYEGTPPTICHSISRN